MKHCGGSVPPRPLCLFLEAQALFRVIDFSNNPQVHGRGLVTLGPSHAFLSLSRSRVTLALSSAFLPRWTLCFHQLTLLSPPLPESLAAQKATQDATGGPFLLTVAMCFSCSVNSPPHRFVILSKTCSQHRCHVSLDLPHSSISASAPNMVVVGKSRYSQSTGVGPLLVTARLLALIARL